jgi:uncharacterized membrane protein YbhN (UPF0104 family)
VLDTTGMDPSARTSLRRALRWLENAFAGLILLAFSWYLWNHRAEFLQVLDVSWFDLTLIGVAVALGWLVNAAQTYVLYRAEELNLGFAENFVLAAAAAFGNYLPLRIGSLIRVRYLKVVHGLGYVRSGSLFGVRLVLMVLASAALGLAGTFWAWAGGAPLSAELVAAFSLLALLSGGAFTGWTRLRSTGSGMLARVWNDFLDGFDTLRTRPRVSLIVLVLVVLQYLLLSIRFLVSMRAVQGDPSLAVLLLFGAFVGLSSFVAITPGGLGVREALMGYVTLATGRDFASGVFAGAVDRSVQLLFVVTLGGLGYLFVWWRVSRVLAEGQRPPVVGD